MSIVNRVSKTSVDESSSGGQLEYGGVSTLSPDEEFLAGLGYKQELKRQFSKIELFGVSFSIIGILPSIASVLVYAIPDGGTSAMVWGWAVSAFLILFIALSLAELGSAMPTSGGLYYWTFWFSSPRWRCLLSWMVGYSNTIGIIGGVASVDWGLAVQIMAAASIGSDMKLTSTTAQTFGVYAAILICHATICSLATVVLARLHNLYIALNLLLCLAVIIALPVATPREFKNDASYALGSFENFNGWPDGYAFILSFLAPVWTIGCFDSSVHISEEATNSRTAVPFAMITSVTIAGVVGWAINMAIAFNMGTDLNAILSSPIGQPLAAIFFNSFGKNGTLALWSFIIIAQFMMGSSILLASSRQTFAFARDGGLPFSRFIYRVNPYTKTPVTGVWFAAFIALALGLLAFAGPAAITAIFSISIAGQNVAYTIPIIARFTSKTMFKPGPFYLGKLSLPVAIIAVTWMIFNTTVFLFPSTPKPGPVPMNYTIVVLGGVFVLALIYFYFPVYGGIHWFNGPVRTFGKVSNNKLSENLNGEGPDDSQEVQTDAKGMDDYGAQLPLHLDELKSAELVPLEWRSWWDWSGKSADRWKALVAASNEFQRRDGCSTADSKGTYPELPDELHFLISEVNLLSLPRFPNIVSLLESTTRPSKPELPAFDISTAGMSPKKHHEVSRMTSYVLDLLKKIHDSSGMDVKYIVDIGAGQILLLNRPEALNDVFKNMAKLKTAAVQSRL
ncbi:hypothetical protein EW145_g293 [Phellinidium pouzarii]|uniref:Amino acid permease/ SLC12A domain-containing protein n=1 Tax=Phellinidium pouzarii TaxID=167371 RepID=A0A4S4LKS5_9AGAM|nr:hypothetical protein EW145_g293 [Phellinidium pouzarii]